MCADMLEIEWEDFLGPSDQEVNTAFEMATVSGPVCGQVSMISRGSFWAAAFVNQWHSIVMNGHCSYCDYARAICNAKASRTH